MTCSALTDEEGVKISTRPATATLVPHYDHGDCLFANLLAQVGGGFGELTIPQFTLWLADLYDTAAPDLAQVLSQCDPSFPKPAVLELQLR